MRSSQVNIIFQKFFKRILFIASLATIICCVTPFDAIPTGFEDVLVVDATLTQELKKHEINLTRSYPFGESLKIERGAKVFIKDSQGGNYAFEENKNGTYIALSPFKAEQGKSYTLHIETDNGEVYESLSQKLPTINRLDKLYAERTTDELGNEGIGIFVDSYDPTSSSKFYRFEYEETYKIVAPHWTPYDAVVISEGVNTFNISVILREREERVCYNTLYSNKIILNNTLSLTEDRLERFPVHFINKKDAKLQHKYSIMVRQWIQSPETYFFFETLQGLSQGSENVFSEDQPGFLEGNLFNIKTPTERVAGYFQVASVSEQRIFVDFSSFFPNEEKPPYFTKCTFSAPTTQGPYMYRTLLNIIYANGARFYEYNRGIMEGGGPYIMVNPECGDCTTLGSNKKPSFWVD